MILKKKMESKNHGFVVLKKDYVWYNNFTTLYNIIYLGYILYYIRGF